MKGIIRKIDLVTRNKKNGGKFNQVVMTVDVITDEEKGIVKTRLAYLSEEYAKKYASFVGLSSKDMIGKNVSVSLEKRIYEKDGVEKVSETIKYINFLDENNQPIIMPKDGDNKLDF